MLKEAYKNTIAAQLKKDLGIKNANAVPKLEKIIINVGIGSYVRSGDKNFDPVVENITSLSGQKPVVVNARISVSNFKLREGQPVGVMNTLRGDNMYEMIERLVHVVLPRIRDFRGITVKGFDGKGNYTLGIKEVTVFPEVNPDNISRNHGLQITIVTSATNDYEGYRLLKSLGMPFKDEVKKPE